MINKLVRIVAFFMCILPGWVYALGLGDIELNSYLNEPLDAKAELLSATQADLDSLKVSLASRADFARAGVEYHSSLYLLQFDVEAASDGKHYIKIHSKENFREPFLNFLLELNWGKGRIIREYTLLIDPPTLVAAAPVITEAATTPVAQAAQAAPATAKPAAPAGDRGLFPRIPIEQEAARTTDAAPQSSARVTGEYAIQRNDTLWGIAQKVRPDRAVTVEQAMMGLFRENPQAFMGENINRLKAGYVLKVPEAEAMSSITTAQAKAEVRRHYEAWKALRGQGGAVAGTPQPELTAPAAPTQPQGRLEIMAPRKEETEQLTDAGVGEDVSTDDGQAPAMAATDGQPHETTELRARVSDLEEEIRNMERMAAVRDQEMAALQRKLAELAGAQTAPVPAEAATPAAAVAEPKAAAEAAKPKAQKPVAAAKPAPAAKPAAEEKGLLDKVLAYVGDSPVTSGIVGGVALLVLLILALLVRQRRHAATGGEFNESILRERRPATPVVEESDEMAAGPAVAEVADEAEESVAQEGEGKVGSSYLSDFAVSSMGNLHQTSEADPLTEADVFLAYGRFQPAEAMIREAIESQPQRTDLKLKLMEIFYAAKDQEAFEKEANALQAEMSTTPEWDKIVDMGKDLCPASALFNAGVAAVAGDESGSAPAAQDSMNTLEFERTQPEAQPSAAEDDRLMEFDTSELAAATDFTETEAAHEDEGVITEIAEARRDSLLDFDLGDFATDSDEAAGDAQDAVSGDELSLDFDLGETDLSTTPERREEELPQTLVMSTDSSIEELADAAGGLDSDTDRVAQELASELEQLAGSFELEDAADTDTVVTGDEEAQDFSFDTVEPGSFEEEAESGLLGGEDEVDTKLDLAKAYIDMGDPDGARSILDEVLEEGNDQQKGEARELMSQL